ncbi:MAG: hypothetical protein WAP03_13190 [Methylorubrum rhodinum]|uniref:hypothetical protein n=1 Tax=Methylorubrum rhodinum TaxID=29428 RepID=UPI003BB1F494
MTLTPHRDAALKSVELSRQHYAALGTKDPVRAIGEAMNVETCRAVLLGAADMLDRNVAASTVSVHVDECIASAVASIALTLAGGDEQTARAIAKFCMSDINRRVQFQIDAARDIACVGTASGTECEGRA